MIKWSDIKVDDVIAYHYVDREGSCIAVAEVIRETEHELYLADQQISEHSELYGSFTIRHNWITDNDTISLHDSYKTVFTLLSINEMTEIEQIKEKFPEYFI